MMFLYFMFGLLFLTSVEAQENIKGYAGMPGVKMQGNSILVRTSSSDIVIDLTKVSPNIKAILTKEDGSKNQISILVPKEAIVSTQSPKDGIRPHCGELPLSYASLKTLADRPDINNQLDFLQAIPEGTLQTFTFNYKSESAQGVGVSRGLPGVIRMSADGKLIIRYTCDPSKPTFNKVEVLTFDDGTSKYKMADFDFTQKASVKGQPPGHRISENPKSCMKCHNPAGMDAAPDPRPNWQQYDQWTGFYGSQDDTFNQYSSKNGVRITEAEAAQEKKDYLDFRAAEKSNPCYSSLPWPKTNYEPEYPYSNRARNSDYIRRPGLKFTEIQCHLTAKRLARRISSKPEYKYLKYSLAMKTMGCSQFKNEMITNVIPEVTFPNDSHMVKNENFGDPYNSNNTYSLAYEVGKTMGIRDKEWTMHFNKDTDATYGCGSGPGKKKFSDLGIGDLLEGELMSSLTQEIPALKGTYSTSKGELETFGQNFACNDDLGGGVIVEDRVKACEELLKAQVVMETGSLGPQIAKGTLDKLKAQRKKDCDLITDESLAPISHNLADIQEVNLKLINMDQKPDAARGKQLVQNNCMECHSSGGKTYDFFNSEERFQQHLKEKPDFIKRVSGKLNDKDDYMPPGDKPLEPLQRADIIEYLKSITKQ
ncbi:MAG: c-type cytochrome [Bacteriovoracaceae bacterium]